MTLLPFIQGRIERFRDLAAKEGWHFFHTTIDEKTVEIHLTQIPSRLRSDAQPHFLLEHFAISNNLGVFRPAEMVQSGSTNVFSAYNLPIQR